MSIDSIEDNKLQINNSAVKKPAWQKIIKTILVLQPIFPVPIYFSVLVNSPPLWLTLVIALMPLVVRYRCTRHVIEPTPFDMPILIFIGSCLIGLIVSPDKNVALGALSSTLASILVYYGITSNYGASKKYWILTGGILCLITMLLSLWFLSQSDRRILPFNKWVFDLFAGLPKTGGPVMQLNTIGALLAVVIPPLFAIAAFTGKSSVRIWLGVLCLFFTGVLFLSDSGAGWLAVLCSLAVILIVQRRWLATVLIPMGGLLIAAGVIFYDKAQWLRMTFSNVSLIGRVELWENTITLLKGKATATGLGLGAWYQVYNSHYGIDVLHVHNSYLQLYCDTGILGGIAFIIAAVIFLRLSVKILKSSKQNQGYWTGIGLIGSFIAGAIFSIFDVTYSITDIMKNGYVYLGLPLLWIFAALLVISSKNDK